jgi:hypothetical protein
MRLVRYSSAFAHATLSLREPQTAVDVATRAGRTTLRSYASRYADTRTHKHTHIHTSTHTHTHTHTHKHTRTDACAGGRARTHTHTQIHAHIHAHTHAHTHTHCAQSVSTRALTVSAVWQTRWRALVARRSNNVAVDRVGGLSGLRACGRADNKR